MRAALRHLARFAVALLLLCAPAVSAQEPAKPPAVSPHVRLLAARRICIEHSGGRLPNDVIGDAFQGWGHYIVVNDPAQADLIVSISAPVSVSGGVSVGGGVGGGGGGRHGVPPPGSGTPSAAAVTQIRLSILDAHDRVVLWSASEQPASAIKESKREDNEVDASLRLFRRFRNAIEPEPAP